MRLTIDTEARTLVENIDGERRTLPLYSPEALEVLSRQWLKVCWDQKHPYTFTWLGRPIIQLPQDMVRIQEVIYRVKPDVIVETGIAHGGALIYYASLCKAMDKGRVIGIDIELRPHNRAAIEAHELYPLISLIDGSSVAPEVVVQVKAMVAPGETVIVILDSCHTKAHVLQELEAYHDLIGPGSYIVASDGFMKDLYDVPRGKAHWRHDNPYEAAREFAAGHREFVIEQPPWPFNESNLTKNISHWPGAWLRRK